MYNKIIFGAFFLSIAWLILMGANGLAKSEDMGDASGGSFGQNNFINLAELEKADVHRASPENIKATVKTKTIWPKNKAIDVCWENPTNQDEAGRKNVEKAVKETWESVEGSDLVFKWLGACTSESRGIHILIDDQGPHVKSLGAELDGKANGMVLNFLFNNWSPSCITKKDFCSKVVAVHEFGHAIGFAHEQNRPDAPQECQNEAQGTDGDFHVTIYDPVSVMNYCNPNWNNNGILSKWDKYAVKEIYPVH